MKKIYLILLGLFLSWGYSWGADSEFQKGKLSSNPALIELSNTLTLTYEKGTSFSGWEPELNVHLWLIDNTGTTLYDTPWISGGNDASLIFPSKQKMTKQSDGKYTFTISSLTSYFSIKTEDINKIYKIGVIVRANYGGDKNRTIEFFFPIANEDLTYSVSVPSETEICFIAGEMNAWSFTPMKKDVNNTFSITLRSSKAAQYKYSCSTSWDNNETNNDGTSKSNRTYSANDAVVKWKANYVPSINLSDFSMYGVNTLGAVKNLTLAGDWTNEDLDKLKTALGANQMVQTINFSNTLSTNWNENYFANINPSCAITTSAQIALTPASTINLPKAITATEGYTYQYTPTKYADGTNGWETICLPFNATEITASKSDETDKSINFFTNSTSDGDFWLKSYKESTALGYVSFDYAPTFEANKPYIIAIPGSKWGAESDLTDWAITFKGTGTIQTTEANTTSNNYIFKGNYATSSTLNSVYTLNVAGSNFELTESASIAPFKAYMSPVAAPNNVRMLSFGNGGATGLEQVFSGKATNNLNIIPAMGALIINTNEAKTVLIYSIDGRLMRTVQLQEGNNTINGLNSGIYLIGNQKATVL